MLKSIKVVSICHFWGKIIELADLWKIVFSILLLIWVYIPLYSLVPVLNFPLTSQNLQQGGHVTTAKHFGHDCS